MSDKIQVRDDLVTFFCPGCNMQHHISVGEGDGPRWNWNGSKERPTFTPSVLVRNGHFAHGAKDKDCWCDYHRNNPDSDINFKCVLCHTFITDGKIQYLDDCSHELAGQTIDLPPIIPQDRT